MSVILNNNHNFDHFDHLNHLNQRIRYMNIKYSLPKRLDIKITSTDTNILYQYLSNNYLNFQLNYSDNICS
jgi:hypothetical protein